MSEVIETNSSGGKNSLIKRRFDLIPASVLLILAEVFYEGSIKYTPDNWKKVPAEDHLNHMLNHIFNYKIETKNRTEHIAHALCRCFMWVYMEIMRDKTSV